VSAGKTFAGRHLTGSPARNTLRFRTAIAAFLFASSLHAQEPRSAEVKLLLQPNQVRTAVTALQAGGKTRGLVYFYDTPALDLLSKGLILRFRKANGIDLTTKYRPLSGQKLADPSNGREHFKCEADLNDGVVTQSFSLQTELFAVKAPETGENLFHLLSEGQKELIAESKVPIDWQLVKRIAEIRSTVWTVPAKQPLGKVSMELWEWPTGSILELSTRVPSDAAHAADIELRELASKNGLALSTNQEPKTGIVLREITAPHRQ
jgi:hypothetical protein